MNRFLSKREKEGGSHRRDKSRDKSVEKKTRPNSSEGFMGLFKTDPAKKADKEASNQIATLKNRLSQRGYTPDEPQITYALNSKHAEGDQEKAFDLLLLFQESVDGIVKPYNPLIHMRGAENRDAVTCYLDSVLFAMFARLGSFEPILYTRFDDEPRRRLSTLIRLWVNMLRTGMLIQTDITEQLQEALKACGWEEAALCQQQDTSEAFSFITETLRLPLLTLKMDIYHTGKEDAKDDHKYIHERLLEVAVPDEVPGAGSIKLEDCLESYFNNRVEVKRHLERSNTLSSVISGIEDDEKGSSQHVEISELSWSTPNTPLSQHTPSTPLSPGGRHRNASIIRHRILEENQSENTDADVPGRVVRKNSTRKEVLMPAWQFFNLIRPCPIYFDLLPYITPSHTFHEPRVVLIGGVAWYTNTQPSVTDADIATHFAQTRPVLGICLKRYGMTDDFAPIRKNTPIDIPLDIRLPHFIQDDMVSDEGPLMSNFKLSLQSIICHRGASVNSGHYISFIRVPKQSSDGEEDSDQKLADTSDPPRYSADRWLKFDDSCIPRVQYVDIEKVFKTEMPYLLFYQVQPTVDISPPPGLRPPSYTNHVQMPNPSYTDSAIAMSVTQSSPTLSDTSPTANVPLPSPLPVLPGGGYFDGGNSTPPSTAPTIRFSDEIEREPRRSLTLPDGDRRGSMAMTEASITSSFAMVSSPPTPIEETTGQRMSRAAQRFKSSSKSRPTSSSGENRISSTFTRTLNMMKSNVNLNKSESTKDLTISTSPEIVPEVPALPDARISIDEGSRKPGEEVRLGRKRSKKGKDIESSKEPIENGKAEKGHHHSHSRAHSRSHRSKEKGKEKEKGGDAPDRECTVM